MADGASEMREALERLIERKVGAIDASLGVEPGPRLIAPTNPHAGGVDQVFEAQFSTGYSGGLTIVPAMYDVSVYDGGDVYTD